MKDHRKERAEARKKAAKQDISDDQIRSLIQTADSTLNSAR